MLRGKNGLTGFYNWKILEHHVLVHLSLEALIIFRASFFFSVDSSVHGSHHLVVVYFLTLPGLHLVIKYKDPETFSVIGCMLSILGGGDYLAFVAATHLCCYSSRTTMGSRHMNGCGNIQ